MENAVLNSNVKSEDIVHLDMELPEMYTRLQELENIKYDVLVPASKIISAKGKIRIPRNNAESLVLEPNDYALGQIFDKLQIPRGYGRRMAADYPELMDQNVNGWLEKESEGEKMPRNFLVRSYSRDRNTGRMRAMLSDSYLEISSFRIVNELLALLSECQQESGFEIKAKVCTMTDRSIFLRFYAPELEQVSYVLEQFRDTKTGNKDNRFFSGMIVRNSEVGASMFEVAPRIITGAFGNGNIYSTEAYSRKHVGVTNEKIGDVVWSPMTIETEIAAIMSKTKDCMKRWLSKDYLGKKVAELEALAEIRLEYPLDTVVNIAQDLNLSQEKTKAVASYLLGCGLGNTAFGVMQAFTGVAKELSGDDQWMVEGRITKMQDFSAYDKENKGTNVLLN